MNMAVDVGFDLRALYQLGPQYIGVFDAAREVDRVAANSRVMVRDDDKPLTTRSESKYTPRRFEPSCLSSEICQLPA